MGNSIDRGTPGTFTFMRPQGCMPYIILRLLGFLRIRDTERRGNKITAGTSIYFAYMSPTLDCQYTFQQVFNLQCLVH